MKKLVTSVLAVVIVISMLTFPAFAATTDTLTVLGDKDIDVNAVYSDDIIIPTVYSVDIKWGNMEFIYTATGTKNWNPTTKQYDVSTDAAWVADGNNITVTNHSNTAVTASFAFEALSAYSTVTGSFSKASVPLASADKENVTAAELTGTTALTLGGMLDEAVNILTKVGKIIVTIT